MVVGHGTMLVADRLDFCRLLCAASCVTIQENLRCPTIRWQSPQVMLICLFQKNISLYAPCFLHSGESFASCNFIAPVSTVLLCHMDVTAAHHEDSCRSLENAELLGNLNPSE